MVEIARAVLHKAKVIIFDEPTATLTPEEKKYFFDLVRDLKARGVSIVFISHALEEALLLADRITDPARRQACRDRRRRRSSTARGSCRRWSGATCRTRSTARARPRVRPAGERVLTVQNLKMAPMVKNNSLSVFAGQITGVFGLVGAGRTETFKVVAGVLKRDFFHGGEVMLHDKPVRYRVPAPAVRAGIVYVTEDRKVEGFFETMSIARNIYLGLLAKLPRRPRSSCRGARPTRSARTGSTALNVRAIGNDVKVDRTVGRQPAEGRDRQVAGAGAGPDHLRRADARRRRRRHRRDPRADQPAGRRGQGGGGDLVLPAGDHGAVGPHPGLPRRARWSRSSRALEATEEKIMYAAVH